MKKEIWIPVINFEELYEVSNLGRVRNKKTKRIKKDYLGNCGYKTVALSKEGKHYIKTIHKLVIDSFIGTDDKTLTVNHIDHNKYNNNLDNLEYMSLKENIKEAWENGLYSDRVEKQKEIMKGNKIGSRQVYQYDLNNNLIKKWDSIIDACNYYGWHKNGHISDCCRGKRKKSHGYIWKYVEEELMTY